jgi:hypothetical protein
MGRIDQNKDRHSTVTYYSLAFDVNETTAAEWIIKVIYLDSFVSKYIYLWDMQNRNDEGNTSLQMNPKSSLESITEELKKRYIDTIYVSGKFEMKAVVIGIDLRRKIAYITLDNKDIAVLPIIEEKLQLI